MREVFHGATVSFVDHFSGTALSDLVDGWRKYDDRLLVHDPGGSQECVVRRGELITGTRHADPVISRLRRWVDSVHQAGPLDQVRVRLRRSEQDRCVEIASDAASFVHEVAANHVHFGSPLMLGTPVIFGTGSEAKPVPPVPAPAMQRWDPPIVAGVLDTGLDPHPWFAARPWFEAEPEVLDADDDSGQDRQASHGTFVAGVLLRHAPGVTLRARRVLSSLGFTDDLTVAAGLHVFRQAAAARREKVSVVVLTSGCQTADDRCPPVLRAELERFGSSVVVAAAGNLSGRRPFWPAALPAVLAVTATGPDGRLAAFANAGEWVDAAAPGVDVVSSHVRLLPAGRGSSNDGDEPRGYGFARWSGTSFAAPQVAAAVATALNNGHSASAAAGIARRRYPFEG